MTIARSGGRVMPMPSDNAQQLSAALLAIIRAQISASGPLSFADYMQLALYHPQFGYYNNAGIKFGAAGDFITAPEISPLFGQTLAKQVGAVLADLPAGDILEFGAGSGQLAVDILSALDATGQLPAHYYILELSAELQQRQRKKIAEKIPQLGDKVIWLERLPVDFVGVIIANEVLDAMPVQRFCWQNDQVWQYAVDYSAAALSELLLPATSEVTQAVSHFQHLLATGYSSEVNMLLPGWLASLADCVTQGLVLLLDYGFPRHEYYHPQRHMGTLMCHYQHHAHPDPYVWPGLQDITAHVDFTAVAEAAVTAGFAVAGYTTQANFLLSCGLTTLAATAPEASAEALWATSQAVKKLVLPSEMGELFKVMALTKGFSAPLLGFTLKDQREKL